MPDYDRRAERYESKSRFEQSRAGLFDERRRRAEEAKARMADRALQGSNLMHEDGRQEWVGRRAGEDMDTFKSRFAAMSTALNDPSLRGQFDRIAGAPQQVGESSITVDGQTHVMPASNRVRQRPFDPGREAALTSAIDRHTREKAKAEQLARDQARQQHEISLLETSQRPNMERLAMDRDAAEAQRRRLQDEDAEARRQRQQREAARAALPEDQRTMLNLAPEDRGYVEGRQRGATTEALIQQIGDAADAVQAKIATGTATSEDVGFLNSAKTRASAVAAREGAAIDPAVFARIDAQIEQIINRGMPPQAVAQIKQQAARDAMNPRIRTPDAAVQFARQKVQEIAESMAGQDKRMVDLAVAAYLREFEARAKIQQPGWLDDLSAGLSRLAGFGSARTGGLNLTDDILGE
jgi:hypothetical protein